MFKTKIFSKIYPDFNKNVNSIFIGILLTNISTFMLMAFLTIYMNTKLNYDPSSIGIVLTVALISQRGFTFIGGILADKYGIKRIMIIGLLMRSVGYFSYIFAYEIMFIIFSSLIVGIGGALISPSLSASIAIFSGEKKAGAFAYQGIVINIAATIGPLIGAIIYKISFNSIFILTSITHLLFVVILRTIPYDGEEENTTNSSKKFGYNEIKRILRDRYLIYFTLITSGFWFLQTQISLTVPLYLSDYFNNEALIGLVYGLNGVLVIVLQYRIVKLLQNRISKEYSIVIGSLFVAMSFASVPIFSNYFSIIIFTILFSVGGMCIIPFIDDITSTIAPAGMIASYMGFISFGWAIGGSIGNLSGGYFYEIFVTYLNVDLLWLFYFFIGIINTLCLFIFVKYNSMKRSNSKVNSA